MNGRKFRTRELKKRCNTNLNESDKVCNFLLSLRTLSKVILDFVKARLLDEEVKLNTRIEKACDVEKKITFILGSGTSNHFVKENINV